jgi:hypothetical protein
MGGKNHLGERKNENGRLMIPERNMHKSRKKNHKHRLMQKVLSGGTTGKQSRQDCTKIKGA